MRFKTKLTLILAATVLLMSCGGGGGGGETSRVATSNANFSINAATGALVSQALNGVPLVFPNGVPDMGTQESTTVTLTNTGVGTPTFAIDSGIFISTGELGFGSCKFSVKKSELKSDIPTVEINDETGELIVGTPKPGVIVGKVPSFFLDPNARLPQYVLPTLPADTRARIGRFGARNYGGRSLATPTVLAAGTFTVPTELEIDPCDFTLATAGHVANGTLQDVQVSVTFSAVGLIFGSNRSRPATTTVTIEANGDILITQPNGLTQRISGVPTGLITGLN